MRCELVAPLVILKRTGYQVTDGTNVLWIEAMGRIAHNLPDTRIGGSDAGHPKRHRL